MNFTPFTGHIPTAAVPTIHQFAAKLGYDGSGHAGTVLHETRYQPAGTQQVQFTMAPVDGVKFRQAESVVVVSAAQPGTVTLAGLAPLHTGQYSLDQRSSVLTHYH